MPEKNAQLNKYDIYGAATLCVALTEPQLMLSRCSVDSTAGLLKPNEN